ncbi:unnamed protein product, partial [Urochloa humidicola]
IGSSSSRPESTPVPSPDPQTQPIPTLAPPAETAPARLLLRAPAPFLPSCAGVAARRGRAPARPPTLPRAGLIRIQELPEHAGVPLQVIKQNWLKILLLQMMSLTSTHVWTTIWLCLS